MKLRTQLYIDTSENILEDEPNYELVEFFDFEQIEITETIKNIQEFDVVFTDYTKEFVVPASKNNNKIFQHYYSTNLINSFDARIKRRARIFINGVFFKQGFVRLSSSKIKNGYAYSYTLNFFGGLSGLSDVLGEDKLASLDFLSKFNHEFNLANVKSGLTKGLQYNGFEMEEYTNGSRDIVYPLISVQNRWFYDSQAATAPSEFQEGLSVNIYNDVSSSPSASFGINYKQLKPAIKISNVFQAIEERYESINFKPDCFLYSSRLDELYLLLHNRKGSLSQGEGDAEPETNTLTVYSANGSSDFNLNNLDERVLPIITFSEFRLTREVRDVTNLTFNVNITTPSSGDFRYTMQILDGNNVLASKESTSQTDSLSTSLESQSYKRWDDIRFQVTSSGSVAEYTVSMDVSDRFESRTIAQSLNGDDWTFIDSNDQSFPTIDTTQSFTQNVELFRQIPDMTILDFMTGVFKMFNLVADVDEDGLINVVPLNEYYLSGVDRDITDYVDSYNYDVERLQLYGNINFKYSEPKTFGIVNHNEQTQDEYGDLSFDVTENGQNNNFVFDKSTYEVKVPFEKLYFDRLSDEFNGNITPIVNGWLVNEDQEPIVPKAVLFFNINSSVNTSLYKFGLLDDGTYLTSYNRPSNFNSDESLSINFNAENTELGTGLNSNSLFEIYYKSYISNIFNKQSRNLKMEARFPLSFLFEYNLSDRLLINGSPYFINEVTTNLNTGKSQLDLISAYSIDLEDFVDTTPPADVVGLSLESGGVDRIRVMWNPNSETDLAGYKVYVYEVLYATIGTQTSYGITGLTAATSYDIKITAYDEAGNESLLSSATELTVTTGTASDNTPPTQPKNLIPTIIGSTGFSITWDESTDDVAVTGYTVYLDGIAEPTTTNNSYTFSGLTANTKYDVYVEAFDAAGNTSIQSETLTVKTIVI